VFAYDQRRGDLLIRLAGRHQNEHLHFAAGQPARCLSCCPRRQGFYTREIGSSAQLLEHAPCRVQLDFSSVGIAEFAEGEPDEDLSTGGFEWCAQFAQGCPRPAERVAGSPCVTLAEQSRPRGVVGHGIEERCVDVRGDACQLLSGGTCRREVVCG